MKSTGSITITSKNIVQIMKRASKILDKAGVEGIYPRRFWTQFGGGVMEKDGKIVLDPPQIITKESI